MNDVTNLHGPDDPETEERLAAALRREAESVHPAHRLSAIRAEGRRRRTGRLVGVVAAAMVGAVGAGLVVGVLVQRSGPMTATTPQHETRPATTRAEPNPSSPAGTAGAPSGSPSGGSGSPSASGSGSLGTTGGSAVPVYWQGTDGKLYREYLPPVTPGDPPVVAAIETMLTSSPLDPDYRSGPWQPVTGVKVTRDGEDLTVDLPAAAFDDDRIGEEAARQALQQLVYTATAAVQAQGSVTVLIDGKPGTAWDRVDVGTPISRDVAARAAVWITEPQQDADVRAGRVTIKGSATAFEGNLTWKVTREDGSLVQEGHTMAGSMGDFEAYAFELDLEPGTYVVTVTAPDMSGRTAGESDDKTFTVT